MILQFFLYVQKLNKNLIKKLETAVKYNEITTDEYIHFKTKLKDLDYEAYKERMKKAGM